MTTKTKKTAARTTAQHLDDMTTSRAIIRDVAESLMASQKADRAEVADLRRQLDHWQVEYIKAIAQNELLRRSIRRALERGQS